MEYLLCKYKCCPILVEEEGRVYIKEGEVGIELNREHLENLQKIIPEILLKLDSETKNSNSK